jgi:hypothetical protein
MVKTKSCARRVYSVAPPPPKRAAAVIDSPKCDIVQFKVKCDIVQAALVKLLHYITTFSGGSASGGDQVAYKFTCC